MQRYFALSKKDNIFSLRDDDMYHIRVVMRMKDSSLLEVIYEHKLFICEYKEGLIKIKEEIGGCTTSKEIILLTPILKEQKMDIVLQKATELGVSKIMPIITKRSIIKADKKEETKLIRWNRIVKEASEQSKRNDIPIVCGIKKIDEFNMDGLKIVCSTGKNATSIKKVMQKNNNYDRIILVYGPEGGFDEMEEDKLVKLGFIRVSLGNRILRTETVPLFLLSAINYENME